MSEGSITPPRNIYWCVNHKDPNILEMVQYLICCDMNTTFEQLFQEIKRVTECNTIVSFRYTLGKLNHIIINDDKSMRLAIQAVAENAYNIHQGGIIIYINEEYPNGVVALVLELYFIVIGYFFIFWMNTLIPYIKNAFGY